MENMEHPNRSFWVRRTAAKVMLGAAIGAAGFTTFGVGVASAAPESSTAQPTVQSESTGTQQPGSPSDNGGSTTQPASPSDNSGSTQQPASPSDNGGSTTQPGSPSGNGTTSTTPSTDNSGATVGALR